MSFSICVCGGNAYELAVLGHLQYEEKAWSWDTWGLLLCPYIPYVRSSTKAVRSWLFSWLAQTVNICHLNIEDTKWFDFITTAFVGYVVRGNCRGSDCFLLYSCILYIPLSFRSETTFCLPWTVFYQWMMRCCSPPVKLQPLQPSKQSYGTEYASTCKAYHSNTQWSC